MKTYTCSYKFDGKPYVIHIIAKNYEEASNRLRSIGMTAQVDGELIAEIEASPKIKTSSLEITVYMLFGAFVYAMLRLLI